MKIDIEELKTFTLKEDEYLLIRLAKGTPMRHAQDTAKNFTKILGKHADRALVYVGDVQLEKIKFEEKDAGLGITKEKFLEKHYVKKKGSCF